MSIFFTRSNLDLKSRGITTEILMDILDVEKVSAEEFLDGIISLTKDEVEKIAEYEGISLETLIN